MQARVVREHLIRTAAGEQWAPVPPQSRVGEVLTPSGFECQPVPDIGDFGLRCGSATVSFSAEPPGWHVVIEGDLPDVERFTDTLSAQITQSCGEPCRWLQIT